eukprot:m.64016 g.64016  ORF g.64016 m.64016 type:complete len:236 (-) comp11986_c0_seq1:231-938(-)
MFSASEVIFITGLGLVVIGPAGFPQVARSAGRLLGRTMRVLRQANKTVEQVTQSAEIGELVSHLQSSSSQLQAIRGEWHSVTNPRSLFSQQTGTLTQSVWSNTNAPATQEFPASSTSTAPAAAATSTASLPRLHAHVQTSHPSSAEPQPASSMTNAPLDPRIQALLLQQYQQSSPTQHTPQAPMSSSPSSSYQQQRSGTDYLFHAFTVQRTVEETAIHSQHKTQRQEKGNGTNAE